MYSKDFKRISLNQLRGKWGSVILALLASMLVLGAINLIDNIVRTEDIIQNIRNGMFLVVLKSGRLWLALVLGVVQIWLGGCISYGVSKYLLEFVRYGESNISYIFCGFSYGVQTMLKSFLLYLLQTIFIFLWSLLFIIPGIVAAFAYSQAFYIMADDDSITAYEALMKSKQMMKGYKGRLFCLMLSFIGWLLLCVLTFGIGYIFLAPYVQTSFANFYEYLRGIRETQSSDQI